MDGDCIRNHSLLSSEVIGAIEIHESLGQLQGLQSQHSLARTMGIINDANASLDILLQSEFCEMKKIVKIA